MLDFHGLDCVCCKEKVPQVQEIIDEIQRIMGPGDLTESQKVLAQFKAVTEAEFGGELKEIVAISEAFFAIPWESISVEDLKLDDENKKVGKFFVKDLSDVPGLDVTKALDLSKFNLSLLDSLKFSLSVPTIQTVISISIPLLSVGMKFMVSRKDFSFMPVLDLGVKTRKQAIEKLKGVKSIQPISSATKVETAKKIAREKYPLSKEVNDAINSSMNTLELMDKLGTLGIALYEEIDIQKQVQGFIDNETATFNAPVYDDPDCGNPGLNPAPFDDNLLTEVSKDCCSEDRPPIIDTTPYDTIERQLDQLNTPYTIDEDSMMADLELFLADTNAANDILRACATEKANAVNNYYWFLETAFLNNIAFEYVAERYKTYDYFQHRSEELQKEKERLFEIKQNGLALIQEVKNRGWGNSTYFTKAQYDAALKVVTEDVENVDKDILKNSQEIADWGLFVSTLASEYLPIFAANDAQTFAFDDPIGDKFKSIRAKFSISTNPITDQVGYELGTRFKLRVFPIIMEECKSLFAINSPRSGEMSDYHKMLDFRNGDLADKIWNAFYSYKRIDTFFTYQEQGFKSPKPQYNDKGEPLGPTDKIKVKSAAGDEIEQNVPKDALDLEVDIEVAKVFWPNLENSMKEKINLFLVEYKQSQIYVDYLAHIKAAAREDAGFAFATGTYYGMRGSSSGSSTPAQTPKYSIEKFDAYLKSTYNSFLKYQNLLDKKVSDLDIFIKEKNKCIADQEQAIIDLSQAYARKMGTPLNSPPEKTDCWSKLGSDPVGVGPGSDCPGITKNCYWQQYTDIIQQVSLMPIPDDVSTGQLTRRLFRYYSVAIQIPVPSPAPVVLPTLASGIPDPLISIPMPLIWKHIISINSPIGLFVIWISICGPIPGPFIMYVDENVDPCFLISPKGPIGIPARKLLVPPTDDIALIDFLPIKNLFKVPLELPGFSKLIGGLNFKSTNPDSIDNFIGKIQSKIKAASDSIKAEDPWTIEGIDPKKIQELRARIDKALRNFPPDIDAVQEGLDIISNAIDKKVDGLNIKPIKFPVNPKKLLLPIIGPAEFMESVNKLIDAGTELAEIGLGIPMISLRNKVKILVDRELNTPEIKNKFLKINEDIADFESKLRISGGFDEKEIILERAKLLKDAMKAPLQVVSDKITPEMLGFITMILIPIPLPFPCFENVTIEPFPPYILALVAAIKALPSSIDALPIEEVAGLLSKFIDLSVPLPRVEDAIYFIIQSFLAVVPDLSFPDPMCATQFKQLILASIQNLFKIKIRMPHPGIPQLSIPPSLIKDAIKKAVKVAFAALTSMVIKELTAALENGDFVKVLAVASIIKGILGTDLASISGEDIKSFITSSLDAVDAQLESIKNMIPDIPSIDYMSIKQTLYPTLPPTFIPPNIYPKLPWFSQGPFMEISTEMLIELATPLLQTLIQAPLPLPLALIGASQLPGRLVLSKLHPFSPKEILPSWEKMSTKNLPFVIWLDQFVATAQKQSGICSDYVIPYWLPDL
jgi:hypothetical protein